MRTSVSLKMCQSGGSGDNNRWSRSCMLWPVLGDEGLRPPSPPAPLPPAAVGARGGLSHKVPTRGTSSFVAAACKPVKLAPLLLCAPCKPANRKNQSTTQWYVQQVNHQQRAGLLVVVVVVVAYSLLPKNTHSSSFFLFFSAWRPPPSLFSFRLKSYAWTACVWLVFFLFYFFTRSFWMHFEVEIWSANYTQCKTTRIIMK